MLDAIEPRPQFLDPAYAAALAPATACVSEWQEYSLATAPGESWTVGGVPLAPPIHGAQRLRFGNRVGLCRLERRSATGTETLAVEVLSTKAPTVAEHLSLCGGLVDDLWRRAARLPFTFAGETGRGVTEALRPPTPLFALHFLTVYGPALRQAFTAIAKEPHRLLRDHDAWVPLAAAAEVDADTLLAVVTHPEQLVPTQRLAIAERLRGRAPERVWQRLADESCDAPENRFVRHFAEELARAAADLPRQPWWDSAPLASRQAVHTMAGFLQQALRHEPLVDAGPLTRLPLNSQVLLRRDGYREAYDLWRQFQLARRPLFERLSEAIALRDVATLYEMWVFFWLVGQLEQVVGHPAVIALEPELRPGRDQAAKACFGRAGTLWYNRWRRGYSGWLHPDFLWWAGDRPRIAFDAKFRMKPPELVAADGARREAKRDDLDKMHTYRDALGLAAAACVYPGDVSRFYQVSGRCLEGVGVAELLAGLEGVGALAQRPGAGGA